MKRMVVAVTGTPATGKSSFAKELAGSVKGAKLIEINDVVNRYKLYSGKDRFGSKIVNLGKLSKKIRELAKGESNFVVIVGHLAQELSVRYDIAVVMRADLSTVARREEDRGYQKDKIKENLIAEALDYCGSKMAERCKDTYEVEKDRERKRVKRYIINVATGIPSKKPKKKAINKFPQMFRMIRQGNRYGF